MKKHCWLLLLIVGLSIWSGSFLEAMAGDTDGWTTFHHDSNRSGYTKGEDFTNAERQLWNFSTNAAVWSSPAEKDGYVLVGCKDCNIYCLNASNGGLIWKFAVGNEVDSSPAIVNGVAFVGCDDGSVYAMNISSGRAVWINQIGGKVRSCPLVLDEELYVGSGNHDFYCLNASNGDLIWQFPTQQGIQSSPAFADGMVYFACDDFMVYALNASSGQQIWSHHTGSDQSSPCLYNGCLYIGSYDGYFVALNSSTGNEVWKYQTGNSIVSSASATYGCIYIGSEDNSIYCFNCSTGQKIWQTQTGFWVMSSPAVFGGDLFVGSEDHNLYCLNASSGLIKWVCPTRNMVDSSPAIINGTLYVGSHDYHLYALSLYNSTIPSTLKTPTNSIVVTSWHTFLFDDIACIIGIAVLFLMGRFTYLKLRKKGHTQNIDSNKDRSWNLVHINLFAALIIVVFAVIFLATLWSGPLWAADEKTYAQMAYHMAKSGDYFTPYVYGEPAIWAGKPPMLMWLMSLTYQAFGVTNFAARIWSLLFGVASFIAVFYLGQKLYNSAVGFLSVVVLGTFTTFFAFATHAMTDGPMLFFTLASVYFMLKTEKSGHNNRNIALSGLFFGLALLTKSVEALLIPLIVIPYFFFTTKSFRFLFTKRFGLFLMAAFLLFAPYVVYMNFMNKDFWNCYFVYSSFQRTVTPIEGHAGGFLFYFNYLATSENLLWVALLPFAVGLCAFNSIIRRHKADVLMLVWMVVVFSVFTAAQTKLYWYILPALPAFALAISNLLYALARKIQVNRKQRESYWEKP
jgi:eukaryotic-like serine/threonine-protein kinase